MDAEVEEAAFLGGVLHGGGTGADDVVADRPVERHQDLDIVKVKLGRVTGLGAEVSAAFHVRHTGVILVIFQPAGAE